MHAGSHSFDLHSASRRCLLLSPGTGYATRCKHARASVHARMCVQMLAGRLMPHVAPLDLHAPAGYDDVRQEWSSESARMAAAAPLKTQLAPGSKPNSCGQPQWPVMAHVLARFSQLAEWMGVIRWGPWVTAVPVPCLYRPQPQAQRLSWCPQPGTCLAATQAATGKPGLGEGLVRPCHNDCPASPCPHWKRP